MAMRYRTLKETSKQCVGVFRSHIHGRGLYCTRDIEAGEMVIEYAGELIRATLTDKREKLYESKGIGCYMFRIDDNFVVDATMRGNAARFINHSCDVSWSFGGYTGEAHYITNRLRVFLCSPTASRKWWTSWATSTSSSLPCDASFPVRS